MAQRFGVGEATVSRLLRRQRELGHVVPEAAGGGFRPRIFEDQFPDLLRLVAEVPDATLDQLKDAWRTRHGVDLSRSSMLRSLPRAGITRKRSASGRRSNSAATWKRSASPSFEEVKSIAPDRLIFIDESGCNIAMSPTYGRAPRGQRVIDHKPANCGQNVSIVGAVRADRVLAHQTFDGAVNGPKFIDFVRRRLVPRLYPGDVVVPDNFALITHPRFARW